MKQETGRKMADRTDSTTPGSWPIPVVSVSSSTSVHEEEASAAFSIPTVSVSSEADQKTLLSQVWYVPASATDFDLQWLQFVMQQYYQSHHPDFEAPKIKNFSINMARSPEDETAPSKG